MGRGIHQRVTRSLGHQTVLLNFIKTLTEATDAAAQEAVWGEPQSRHCFPPGCQISDRGQGVIPTGPQAIISTATTTCLTPQAGPAWADA